MKWSFRIAKIAGIGVHLHFTFILLVGMIGVYYFREAGPRAAVQMVSWLCALFGCVLLHEFGHALTARRFGVRTRDITVLPIGGIARLERIPRVPRQEFLIAVAGPLVNVVIAFVLAAVLAVAGVPVAERIVEFLTKGNWRGQHELSDALFVLLLVNVAMFAFNLIPAFPLDGGRILRSLLASVMSYGAATQIAANTGQLLAIGMGIVAVTVLERPMVVIIAAFVFFGAAMEASAVKFRISLEDLPTRYATVSGSHQLRLNDSLRLAAELLLDTEQSDFPVIDAEGNYQGMLTRRRLLAALRDQPRDSPVRSVQLREVEVADANAPIYDVYERMGTEGVGAVPVVEGGKLAGMVTRSSIANLVMVRQALSGRGRG